MLTVAALVVLEFDHDITLLKDLTICPNYKVEFLTN